MKDGAEFPARLDLPANVTAPVPLVVMVPGTEGVDERQSFHRPGLLARGIATLEIDTKSGVFTSAADRPAVEFFLPVVFGALRAARAIPDIDPTRIAIMGWSAGATVSVRASYERDRRRWMPAGQSGFAAHIGLYGGCSRTRDLANVPILILVGDKDTFGANRGCAEFAHDHRQVKLKIYPGARHGFDKPDVNRGKGDRVMEWKEDAAIDARERVVEFLIQTLAR